MTSQNASPLVFGACPSGVRCRPRAAAYAVICNHDGRVAAVSFRLLGRDRFWLPGGGMLDGETAEQTIVCEVREELGRNVRLLREKGQAIQYFFAGDEACWYRMAAWFFSAEFQGDAGGRGEFELHWVDPVLQGADFFHECHAWAARQAAHHRELS